MDDTSINSCCFDATRICVKVVDRYKNILPYATGIVSVDVEGDIEVIGPNHISLIGGSIAFWIRTKNVSKKGRAKIKITSSFGINKALELILN